MAISTRKPQEDADAEIVARIHKMIEESTEVLDMIRAIPNQSTKSFTLSNDLNTLIGQVGTILAVMQEVGMAMTQKMLQVVDDNIELTQENFRIALRAEEMSRTVSVLSNVPFDQALDHTAADFMMALESSGIAETNAHGEIAFDPSLTVSKSDLKPLLKEIIDRWVEYRMTL